MSSRKEQLRIWSVGIGCAVMAALKALPFSVLSIFSLPMCEELGVSMGSISIIFSAVSVGTLIMSLAIGRIFATAPTKLLVVVGGVSTVSLSVIEKTHALLRSALNQAVKWEYISSNPAERVTLPKYRSAERDVWSASEAQYALDCCSDPVLHTAMLLALGCSMRIGEILGLTWDCVDFSDESIHDGTAHVFVNKELKRCQKDSLKALAHRGRSQVIFTFPEWKQTDSTTSLVLKSPKTESSVRKVYLPKTVALALREVKSSQDALKLLIGDEYADYGLVIAHEDGRPYEERQIAALLRKLIADYDLRPVVFHSLRHCSASLKLQIGGGNIKAVQGDTGHAQARMVTDLYAHTHNEDRRRLAQKVDEDFFQKRPSEAKKAAADEADLAYQLLQDNPDIAKLIIATLQKKSS